MTLFRILLVAVLGASALAWSTVTASAMEGMTIGPEHSSVKEIIQTDYATSAQLDNAVVVLGRLISMNEVPPGKKSPQVGVLLCDIGEAAFKQANYLSGAEKVDKLKRAAAALVAGADMLKPYQGEHDGFIIQRARAYRFAGMAYLALGDRKSAEASLRNGLAIHWKRFNDNAYQLQFFPTLFDAVDGADEKRKVAEAEIKIARNVYNVPTGDGHAGLEGPLRRLRIAETDGNPLIAMFEAARARASDLASGGDEKGSYAELASAFNAAKSVSDQKLFIGRMKPSPFFIYDDPDAGKSVGWDQYQVAPTMEPYDHVATRFFVDRNLMPFIAEGRNNLRTLLGQWEGIYETGDKAKAAYFCRLIPWSYNGYGSADGYDRVYGGIPPFCANSVQWAAWLRSQGDIGQGLRYLEMGIDLLPAVTGQSQEGKKFLVDSLREMSTFEAYYGSPDSFLSAYERLSDIDADPPAELAFYASIIRDDPIGFETALKALGAKIPKPGEEEDGPGPVSKLPVIGPKVAQAICAQQPRELPAVVRASFCTEEKSIDVETLRAELKSTPNIAQSIQNQPFFAVPDWRLLKLLDEPEYKQVRPWAKMVFAPGESTAFEDRKLSSRERKFLEKPRDYDTYIQQTPADTRRDDEFSKDFDAAFLSTALLEAGKADMARSWAAPAIERYQSASAPQTIFSAWLSEAYEEQTYLDGWRWLILEKPLLANTAFSKHIPQKLSYSRRGGDQEAQSSLDWERVIGAYHGRIIANERLHDRSAAREDAKALVSYIRFVLGLQSFSRNETREVIVRIARPALNEALDVLVDGTDLSPDDLEAVFQIIQMMKPSGTGATIARLAGRLSAVSPTLANLAKQREELRQQWLTMSPEQQDDRKALAAKVDELDAELAKQFPRYVEISGTVAVPAAQVAQSLSEKEALIAFLDTGENYLVMAVTSTKATVIKTAMSSEDVDGLVRDLRRGLELRGGRLPAFRSEAAYQLYRQLFEPIEAKWSKPPENLILVPDGALESIPFAVLLTAEMQRDDFVNGKWFSDRYVVTRVPSVASLTMLRAGANAKAGDQPFLGVGDPTLDGDPDTERGGVDAMKIAALRGGANVSDIRALPRLPETADELRALQKTFNVSDDSLLLGQNATETVLKAEDLTRFQTLAFATHGLLAGEISGLQEAGLIMTPPAVATAIDDGYLSASDIAALNLNADVVLLSACNTAAPEQVGAEGLSGLAKAFFFAGARNLVVSHWAVDSMATAALTTQMFENRAKAADKSYASALGDAMRDLRAVDAGRFAHPLYWGPFEVVGADM
ncbi:CHAT domain-containing protein [Rhizobium leguminosarum]|uniref:CHAT domain-containing protein n=1 Tax=Rhizobium leguminosarum TaxID=384 RepID=UPI001C94DFBC|nr:CHAT domain-containing protein [Rhizobium leguminosarum]MBY5768536.1 CHAT domain-containing protein [Rhizobium leguminosarum]